MVDAITPRGKIILRLLSRREREILPLVCAGLSNRRIGERLLLVDQVVKNYLRGLFKKVGVASRHELMTFAWRHGLVAPCPCQARSEFLTGLQANASATDDSPAPTPPQHVEELESRPREPALL